MLFFFLVLSGAAFYCTSANNVTIMGGSGGVLTALDSPHDDPPSGWFAYMEKMEARRVQERLEDRAWRAHIEMKLAQAEAQRVQEEARRVQERLEDMARNKLTDRTLQQLAEAVVTQDVSTRLDDCAPSTALILEIKPAHKNSSHCTAVPMPSPPPLSPYLAGSSSSSSFLSLPPTVLCQRGSLACHRG